MKDDALVIGFARRFATYKRATLLFHDEERLKRILHNPDRPVQIIFSERGAHFDPDMVDAFIEIQDTFDAIAKRFADTDADMQHKIEYMANAIAEIAVM